ncbi:MAG: sulfatase-like hydrolase/transferase [Akkermansiaceae bacterium]|jgi:arylsulfatase A-like enzyme|nr:sulfatase-like hydrolase/transferase [Akkermansiaceae bacterium]
MKKRFTFAVTSLGSLGVGSVRSAGLCALLVVFLGSTVCCIAARRPNVILILTDDQSPRNPPVPQYPKLVSPPGFGFGGDRVFTPHIDRMAREGIVMTNANVACPVCSPSRYTTLTGRHATRSRGPVFNHLFPAGTMARPENNVELGNGEPSLPRLLQAAGYTTAWVGKSHIIEQEILEKPSLWGSAAAAGLKRYPLESDPRTDPLTNQAMRDNQQWWRSRLRKEGFDWVGAVYPGNLLELFNKPSNVHNVEWTTRSVLDFLDTRSLDGEKPFFLYYGTTIPHGPDPWAKTKTGFANGLDADPGYTGEGYRTDLDYSFMPSRESIKKEVSAAGFDVKHAWLTWFDHSIGAILRRLDERGLARDTLVIVSSDHGTWRYGKTTLYDGGLKVPLVMRWPAAIKPGSVYPHLVLNTDYATTILDLAEAKLPADYQMDGVSLAPVLKSGETAPLRDETFHEIGFARAVKTRKWKYIDVRYPPEIKSRIDAGEKFPAFGDAPPNRFPYWVANKHLGYHSSRHNPNYFQTNQLYDLENDPMENHNLVDRHPEVVADLKARLRKHLATFPNRPFGEFTR